MLQSKTSASMAGKRKENASKKWPGQERRSLFAVSKFRCPIGVFFPRRRKTDKKMAWSGVKYLW